MGEIMDIVYEMEESVKACLRQLAENAARKREEECIKMIFKQTDNEKILSKLDEILDEIKKLSFTKQEYYVYPTFEGRPSCKEYYIPYEPIPWYDFYVPPPNPNWMITCGVDWGVNDTHACLGDNAVT
jgi:hypothetical protein